MRICIVARSTPVHGIGGMQDHASDLAHGLAAAGHDVVVIAGEHPEGVGEEWGGGVQWRYVDARADDFTDPLWRLRSWQEFMRAQLDRPFDVVHGEGSAGLELVRRNVHRRTPFVVMFHGNYVGLVRASLARQLAARRPLDVVREQRGLLGLTCRHFAKGNWRLFRSCEAIVPSRQQLADTRRSHRLDPNRIHVVPNGVDEQEFRPRPREPLRAQLELGNGFLFLCAGRLSREKGSHHAIHALAALRDDAPDARLLIVGEGRERRSLEELGHRLGLGRRILFAGAQPPERMPLFFGAADAFLFPTERDEAAPLVVPQAMACALPVIASARGGIPEVIDRPGANGILVEPGDTRALAAAMRHVYGSPEVREGLGAEARSRIERDYTVAQMVARTLDVYETARSRLSVSRREPGSPALRPERETAAG